MIEGVTRATPRACAFFDGAQEKNVIQFRLSSPAVDARECRGDRRCYGRTCGGAGVVGPEYNLRNSYGGMPELMGGSRFAGYSGGRPLVARKDGSVKFRCILRISGTIRIMWGTRNLPSSRPFPRLRTTLVHARRLADALDRAKRTYQTYQPACRPRRFRSSRSDDRIPRHESWPADNMRPSGRFVAMVAGPPCASGRSHCAEAAPSSGLHAQAHHTPGPPAR